MAANLTFNDWNAVSQAYGADVSTFLQNQGVPLSGVSQYISQNAPNQAFQAGTGVSSSGLLQALQAGTGSGSGQSQNSPAPNSTTSTSILTDPLYNLTRLGAAATNQPMVVNPNPSQQPINQQGGVFSGAQTPMVSPTVPTVPQGPWTQVPGLLGGQAPRVKPSSGPPVTGGNLSYPGGAQFNQGTPYASVPPPAAPSGTNVAAIKLPAPPFMYTSAAPTAGPPVTYASGTPTGSTGSIALAAANPPQHFAGGGSVDRRRQLEMTQPNGPQGSLVGALPAHIPPPRAMGGGQPMQLDPSQMPMVRPGWNQQLTQSPSGQMPQMADAPWQMPQSPQMGGQIVRPGLDQQLIPSGQMPPPPPQFLPSSAGAFARTPPPTQFTPSSQGIDERQIALGRNLTGMEGGGSVGDTDTVPAMLTPGEYVINRQAAQQIGEDKLDKLNKAGKKKKGLGAGLDWLGGLGEPMHMQGGGEIPDVTGGAQNWAYQQLSPEEQQLLIQAQSGGTGDIHNPQVTALQKKLAGYVTQYIDANPASGSQAPPNANTVAQGMFSAGYKPGPVSQGQPQTTTMQVGPPTPSAQEQAYNATHPAPPAPGESNMPTSQQLTNLTNSPQGQWANMTPTQKREMGVASGISNIGQAWANAAQNIANENWKPIAPGSWANPSQYENNEYNYYQRYHDQMQQLMI